MLTCLFVILPQNTPEMPRFATILFCLLCVNAMGQPTYLLNRSYPEKWRYIDSLTKTFKHLSSQEINNNINNLEIWASEHDDPELSGELAILGFRNAKDNKPSDNDVKKIQDLAYTAHENNMPILEADALQAIGDYYWPNNQKQGIAIESYIAAYKIYNRYTPDEFPSKKTYIYTLGGAYYRYDDIDNAIKFLKAAVATPAPDTNILRYTTENTIGLCYRKIKNYDSSEWYFRKVYDEAKRNNDSVWIGIAGGNIGITYFYQKRYEEAKPLLEKDIEYGLAHRIIQNAAASMYILASIYYDENNIDKAKEIITNALSICESKPFWPKYPLAEQLYTLLYKIYAAQNDMRNAYLYADSALTAKDSVVSQFNSLSLTKAQEKAEFDQHKIEEEQLEISHLALAKKRNETVFFITSIVVMLFVIGFILRSYKTQKDTNNLLSKEKKKSEDLLLNILPPEVAEELKNNGAAHAKQFDDVTVMFTDFVNFTEAGERMSPQELVGELHTCFKAFDDILSKYDIEKIKTVGDAYLAVSGLPAQNPKHATEVVAAAIEIREFMRLRKEQIGNTTFGIRIGINSGSVVAGIVGVKKFAYDIWGDTVNTAARMEQTSEEGRINISDSTYRLVKEKYACTHRGKIEVKNKGEIDMYFVS